MQRCRGHLFLSMWGLFHIMVMINGWRESEWLNDTRHVIARFTTEEREREICVCGSIFDLSDTWSIWMFLEPSEKRLSFPTSLLDLWQAWIGYWPSLLEGKIKYQVTLELPPGTCSGGTAPPPPPAARATALYVCLNELTQKLCDTQCLQGIQL